MISGKLCNYCGEWTISPCLSEGDAEDCPRNNEPIEGVMPLNPDPYLPKIP